MMHCMNTNHKQTKQSLYLNWANDIKAEIYLTIH